MATIDYNCITCNNRKELANKRSKGYKTFLSSLIPHLILLQISSQKKDDDNGNTVDLVQQR